MSPRPGIVETPLPSNALLRRYDGGRGYSDCFAATVAGRVDQAAYVEAFYTTPLFRMERLVLAALLARPSTDAEALALAKGQSERFAAWTVEGREADQILLCDFQGATRSWLMSAPAGDGTTLYFGTAIVPRRGGRRPSAGFRALVPFHRLYARALLAAAVRRLTRHGRAAC